MLIVAHNVSYQFGIMKNMLITLLQAHIYGRKVFNGNPHFLNFFNPPFEDVLKVHRVN